MRAWVHIADVSWFVRAGSPLDHGAAERAFSTYVPGLVAPMLPPELSDDACSLRPHVDRLCVTVELPPSGRAALLPLGDQERREADLRPGAAARRARRRSRPSWSSPPRTRRSCGGGVSPAARSGSTGRSSRSSSTARAGSPARTGEGEPEAHALVEELMIAANEAVAGLLAGRRREALYRVHERPEPQAISLLVAKLADLDVPTPPVPERLSAGDAAKAPAAISERVNEYVAQSGRGREAFPRSSCGRSSRRATTRATSATRVSPARPIATSRARSAATPTSSCTARCCASSARRTSRCPSTSATLAEHTSAREREAAEIEYLADDICLAWLLEATLFERGWDEPSTGEITGADPVGPVRPLRRRVRGLPACAAPPERLFELNAVGTALAGKRGGGVFRLGDTIDVRVEEVRRWEGKVELSLAGRAGKRVG